MAMRRRAIMYIHHSNQEIYGESHRFARKFAASQRKSGVGNALISVSIAKYVKSVEDRYNSLQHEKDMILA